MVDLLIKKELKKKNLGEEDKKSEKLEGPEEKTEKKKVTARPREQNMLASLKREAWKALKVGKSGGKTGSSAKKEGSIPSGQSP